MTPLDSNLVVFALTLLGILAIVYGPAKLLQSIIGLMKSFFDKFFT